MVEKDWHVVRALRVLSGLQHGQVRPIFSGGTSLSLGWGLIKRFSEDIDFKVIMPAAATRTQRRAYREAVVAAMIAQDFQLIGDVSVRDESRFFNADFRYPSQFNVGQGLRPHLRLEMSLEPPALESIARPIQSLVSRGQRQAPEITEFPCVDPIETAADKLSALAWRVCVRQRGGEYDEPTMIRHLHDLAALEQRVTDAPQFKELVQHAALKDSDRGGGQSPKEPAERFAKMLDLLTNDKLWAKDYDEFVQNVSFAADEERISFASALAAVRRLIAKV
jgi:hypothetical protein